MLYRRHVRAGTRETSRPRATLFAAGIEQLVACRSQSISLLSGPSPSRLRCTWLAPSRGRSRCSIIRSASIPLASSIAAHVARTAAGSSCIACCGMPKSEVCLSISSICFRVTTTSLPRATACRCQAFGVLLDTTSPWARPGACRRRRRSHQLFGAHALPRGALVQASARPAGSGARAASASALLKP